MSKDQTESLRTTHDLDLVEVFRVNHFYSNTDSKLLKGLLEANGIDAYISGRELGPNGMFVIKVARKDVPDAQRILKMADTGKLDLESSAE